MSLGLYRDLTSKVYTGFSYTPPQVDDIPNPITGQTINGAEVSILTEFNPVQITGIDTVITVTIANGEIAVSTDGITYGAFSSANQTIENNYWVIVRATSSADYSETVTATLTAGGVSAAFVLTTWNGVYLVPKYLMLVTESTNYKSTSSALSIPVGTYTFVNNGTFIPSAPSKDPSSIIDYGVSWAGWLAQDDTIARSDWFLDTGLTQVTKSRNDTETAILISGGVTGTEYTATNRITTSAGRVEERSMIILCENR